jgi:uncharacterized protein
MTQVLEIPTSPNGVISFTRIQSLVDQIVRHFRPRQVLLFGSYAEGRATPDSDVDLLIVFDRKVTCQTSLSIRRHVKLDFPLDMVVYNSRRLRERLQAGDCFLSTILERGKTLYAQRRR